MPTIFFILKNTSGGPGFSISESLIHFLERSGIDGQQELLLFSDGQEPPASACPAKQQSISIKPVSAPIPWPPRNFGKGDLALESVGLSQSGLS
ncbi:MAG: hypothetical protein Ct9H90mP9_3920 [Pseudomonadota bacterium]|nr:MAG: hypothetical protein Ct9H90mP9_3920 [Pseudomonadota bacterium]